MPQTLLNDHLLPIAVTMGDPAGIGTEITLKAWLQRKEQHLAPFFVLSQKSLFEEAAHQMGKAVPFAAIHSPLQAIEAFPEALPILEVPRHVEAVAGQPDPASAKMTLHSISASVDYVRIGESSSIVTNPINKHVLYQAGFEFPGHTEYLAKLADRWEGCRDIKPVMMLASKYLKTVPLTIHMALEDVASHITSDLIIDTARIISDDMTRYFGLDTPRIAVAGLNPHAGEGGAMGTAEQEIIEPALKKLQKRGVNVSGPYPADTLFHAAARQNYDVVLGMYHDQALIPIKTLGFDEGVNTTLGLPFVRTSPDHGTAYNIAGKGIANPTSLIEALKMADRMATHAREHLVP